MPVRPIVKFPDSRLRAAAQPVTLFDGDLRGLATDVLDTMRAAPGIGMTAAHIGVLKRLVAIELSAEIGPRFYVNPSVVWASAETACRQEGSVSMPGASEAVERPARVRVAYQDLEGAEHTEECDGLLSVCQQHEIDQLDGVFWLQRISRLKRERLIKRYEKIQRLAQ